MTDPAELLRDPAGCPPVIFCIWFGPAAMSDARRRSLDVLRRSSGAEVVLVTEGDVARLARPEAPISPHFELLTAVHRSDYLRAYLMAHYGGGYSDVKQNSASWAPSFELLRSTPALDAVGYRLPHRSHAARFGLPTRPMVLGRPVSSRALVWHPAWWRHGWYGLRAGRLPGVGAFIMRRGSVLASAYLGAIEAILERRAPALSDGAGLDDAGIPKVGFHAYSSIPGYPLSWLALSSDVLHPLALRNRRRVDLSLPVPRLRDYR